MKKKKSTISIQVGDIEEWMDVKGFEGLYKISNLGRVYSVRNRKILQPRKHFANNNENPYLMVALCVKKDYQKYIHRLVAEHFIPNPENRPFVNHKDCNPSNNLANNLEWCTHIENMKHGVLNKRFKGSAENKKLFRFTYRNGNVFYIEGLENCRKFFNFNSVQAISRVSDNGAFGRYGKLKDIRVDSIHLKDQRLPEFIRVGPSGLKESASIENMDENIV